MKRALKYTAETREHRNNQSGLPSFGEKNTFKSADLLIKGIQFTKICRNNPNYNLINLATGLRKYAMIHLDYVTSVLVRNVYRKTL